MGYLLPSAVFFFLSVGAVLLFLGLLLFKRSRSSVCLVAFAWIFAACGWMQLHVYDPSPYLLRNIVPGDRETVSFTGRVTNDPEKSPQGGGVNFKLCMDALSRDTSWQPARGTVYVRTHSCNFDMQYGDQLELSGLLRVKNRGCRNERWMASGKDLKLLGSPKEWNLFRWCYAQRRKAASVLSVGLEDDLISVAVLHALLLGSRSALSPELSDVFAESGTIHVFAISGLHIALWAWILSQLLRFSGLSRPQWIFVLAPLLLVYTAMTGLRPSAVRACVMALLFWGAPFCRRRPDAPSALSAAALLILLFDPLQLLTAGFQLSFVVVIGLLLLYPKFLSVLERSEDEWWLSIASRPRRLVHALAGKFRSLLAASSAAWFSGVPLAAYWFNLIAPVALLANLIVVPATFCLVIIGSLSLFSAGIGTGWSCFFNGLAALLIHGLVNLVQFFHGLPCSHFFVRSPSIIVVFSAYAFLLCALFLHRRRRVAAMLCSAAVVVTLTVLSNLQNNRKLIIFDVGQGNAGLLQMPGQCPILIDAGPDYQHRNLLRKLRSEGVDRLSIQVLTHADRNHLGRAVELLRLYRPDELWISAQPGTSSSWTERRARQEMERIVATAEELGVKVCRLSAGERGELASGVVWQVFNPNVDQVARSANDASLVLQLAYERHALLIMGGARLRVEKQLLKGASEPGATILWTGDHGARGSAHAEWLDLLQPDTVVISVGAWNPYGQPVYDVLERINARSVHLHCTDDAGDYEERWH